jgi:non-heme chloroperoxidase
VRRVTFFSGDRFYDGLSDQWSTGNGRRRVKKSVGWVVVLGVVFTAALHAQDVTGDWQGAMQTDSGLRAVLRISKAECNGLSGTLYSLGEDPHPIPLTSVTVVNRVLHLSIESLGATYEGTLSADGSSIHGTFSQGHATLLDFNRATPATAWPLDATPHKVQSVEVEKNVRLEVVDWGGSGRPLILLAGLGNTAHVFDKFAEKLTPSYHVYGITRRGFGASSAPVPWGGNYAADRLGDDVLAVMDALKIDRPVLVGHSIAGEELSSIGSRHPDKVAGLVYLEGGYGYAFYDKVDGELPLDALELRRRLAGLASAQGPQEQKAIEQQLLDADLPRIEKDLREELKYTKGIEGRMPASVSPDLAQAPDIRRAVMEGEQKYSEIRCPVLAIFALPNGTPDSHDREETTEQAEAMQAGVAGARVILLPNASHYIFQSNEADVLRELDLFIGSLHSTVAEQRRAGHPSQMARRMGRPHFGT